MAAIAKYVHTGRSAPPVCLPPWLENPYRLVSWWDVLKFSTADLIAILDHIESLTRTIREKPSLFVSGRPKLQHLVNSVALLHQSAEAMGLLTTADQAQRVLTFWAAPPSTVQTAFFVGHLEDLALRTRDELQHRLFFLVEAEKVQWITRMTQTPTTEVSNPLIRMRPKTVAEVFGDTLCLRLPAIESDLQAVIHCHLYGAGAATVFHLMRAAEIAVPKIAKLCGIQDPKPSWGTVLDQVEKYTQRTKYDDLPSALKSHVDFLRGIVADMRSMQRAWRNTVTHVEDKIIPASSEYQPADVEEIFSSTRSFLRHLADGLPDWC